MTECGWIGDQNGIQDDGEFGVSGVTVKLYDCNDNFKGQTTTNASGNYYFSDLAPGNYYVKFVLPDGFVFSPQDQGSDDTVDSDANPETGKTVCTELEPGENDLTWDAGIYQPEIVQEPVTVGDVVWLDSNGNGRQDNLNQTGGEPGVSGVTVTLYDTATDQPIEVSPGVSLTDTTDANGAYLFDDLPEGNYYVVFDLNTLPSGFVVTTQDASGVTEDKDSDADPTSGQTRSTGHLNPGDSDLDLDMGLYRPASIGDFVWEDLNGNGIQDGGEPGDS